MPRNPTVPCAGCGKLLWPGSGSLPPGQATCRECRAAQPKHGLTRYNKYGCRCDICRLAKNVNELAYYHRTKTYSPERECRSCGASFITDWHTRWSCSEVCAVSLRRRKQSDRRARLRNAFVETVDPRSIFERDGWRCHICRRKLRSTTKFPHPRAATIDHLVPLASAWGERGSHELANVKTACYACNTTKGNRGGNEQLLLIG